MPIQNWKAAMNRFSIMFEERNQVFLKLYLHRIIYTLLSGLINRTTLKPTFRTRFLSIYRAEFGAHE